MADSDARGFLTFVFTAHVPYVRAASRHPTGEELLHETIAYSLLPTLNTLCDLRDAGLAIPLSLAFSPILLEQLSDNVVQKHFTIWMEEWIEALVDDLGRWERQNAAHSTYLARFSIDWGRETLHSFNSRHTRNLVTTLRDLCAAGAEPLFTASTHAFLPLLHSPQAIHAQLHQGRINTMRHLNAHTAGMWLPECGYSAEVAAAITDSDTRFIIADPTSLPDESMPTGDCYASSEGGWRVLVRDARAAEHIWSPTAGYLGDPLYRSAVRDPRIDISLWRNGNPASPPELYDPYDAYRRAEEHATHFVGSVAAYLDAWRDMYGRPGVVVVPLDAELIGRRWFEGPVWLRAVLTQAVLHPSIRLATPSTVERTLPHTSVTLKEGSWAGGSTHRPWNSNAARPIWEALADVEERFSAIVSTHLDAEGMRERALNQALRELLLAQSSDWPLLASGEYGAAAVQRVTTHLQRLDALCRLIEKPSLSGDDLRAIRHFEDIDNPFPHLNFRIYAR